MSPLSRLLHLPTGRIWPQIPHPPDGTLLPTLRRCTIRRTPGLWRQSIRTLNTRPRSLPDFISTWNPTSKKSGQLNGVEDGKYVVTQDATKDSAENTIRRALTHPQHFQIPHRSLRRPGLMLLNQHLQLARTRGCSNELRALIWRAYTFHKRFDASFTEQIPEQAWEMLWATQAVLSQHNKYRRRHLYELYNDMRNIGRNPSLNKRIAYLEYLFYEGSQAHALEEWDKGHEGVIIQPHHDSKPEYLELGAMMYAFADQPLRASEIMAELFDLYPQRDSTVMHAVFRAYTRSESQRHHEIAYEIYKQSKERLGSKATVQHYDNWLIGFLETQKLHHAKAVFYAMVTHGRIAKDYSDEGINEVLRRVHYLYRLGTDIEKMTSIALFALSALPRSYHRHLFGDWMKSAVVMSAPEAAAQILEMMFKRGLEPDAFYFNLLLKALLRTNDRQNILQAENLGWQMVDKSRKFGFKQSDLCGATDAVARAAEQLIPKVVEGHVSRHIPPANVTTFALLMLHHSSNFQWEHVDYLARQLETAGIQPNSAIMTVLMNNQCRKGKYTEVWKIYHSMTHVPDGQSGVFPDGAAMRCLWKSLRLALGDHATRESNTLPTPRDLLAETIRWWDHVRSRHDADRFKLGFAAADHQAISALIMHCFSYTNDLIGSLVAIHVLRDRFGIFPSGKAASVLQKHVAWTDMQRESASLRQHYERSGVHKAQIEKMGRVYHILQQKRFEKIGMTGDQFACLSNKEASELGINILSEFVRVVLKRQYSPETVENLITNAKEEVGLPDLWTGDMTAYEVA